jgi:hypothetical protein
LGAEGDVPSCDDLAVSSFDEFHRGNCEGAATIMKAGVASDFASCILAQTADELEDTLNTYECKRSAALAACPDPTAQTACDDYFLSCPDTDNDECLAYMNGLTDDGREQMVSCAASGCFGIWSCVEGL